MSTPIIYPNRSNHAVSSSCAGFFTSSTSAVDVTNLSASITSSGKPIRVEVISDGTGGNSIFGAALGTGTSSIALIFRDATEIARFRVNGGVNSEVPSSSICATDIIGAGTYTYKIQIYKEAAGLGNAYLTYSKLLVRET